MHNCLEMGWPCATTIVLVSWAAAWTIVEWVRAANGVKPPILGEQDGE